MAYVGRYGNYRVSVFVETASDDCTEECSQKERRFGTQRHQGYSTSLLEAHTWTILMKLLRAKMQSERF